MGYVLYSAQGTAALAPNIVLKEAQLPFVVSEVDIANGEHRKEEFLRVNPLGKVPALKTLDGRIMTEASAICIFLTDFHEIRAMGPDPLHPDRPVFLSSLMYLSTTVQDLYKRVYYPARYTPEGASAAATRRLAISQLEASWHSVDLFLRANGPFHLGTRYSCVDAYMLMLVSWHPKFDDLLTRYPAVSQCFYLTLEREAVNELVSKQKSISVFAE